MKLRSQRPARRRLILYGLFFLLAAFCVVRPFAFVANDPKTTIRSTQQQNLGGIAHNNQSAREALGSPPPRIVFAGVAQNVGGPFLSRQWLPKVYQLARQISSDFHLVVYENDSTDSTRPTLQRYLGNKSYATLLLEDDVEKQLLQKQQQQTRHEARHNKHLPRTYALAHARNALLHHVRNDPMLKRFDYLVMMDMDGVCGGANRSRSFDAAIFRHLLQPQLSDDWDVVSFRTVPYWDLWAFRHVSLAPFNPQSNNKNKNAIQSPPDMVPLFESVPWPNGLIAVDSAYSMLAVYKMKVLVAPDDDKAMVAQYRPVDDNGEPDCEHVAFHKDLREKLWARVRLSPLVYCEGDEGYRPLPQT